MGIAQLLIRIRDICRLHKCWPCHWILSWVRLLKMWKLLFHRRQGQTYDLWFWQMHHRQMTRKLIVFLWFKFCNNLVLSHYFMLALLWTHLNWTHYKIFFIIRWPQRPKPNKKTGEETPLFTPRPNLSCLLKLSTHQPK